MPEGDITRLEHDVDERGPVDPDGLEIRLLASAAVHTLGDTEVKIAAPM